MATFSDRTNQPGTQWWVITACVISMLSITQAGHTQCEPWAANSDTYNTSLSATGKDQFWIAYRSFFSLPPTLYVNGLIFFPQPNFNAVPGPLTEVGVQYFDQRMVLVVRGFDQKIWATTWNRTAWDGWASYPTPLFIGQPPGFGAKNTPGVGTPNGVLVVGSKDSIGRVWHIRSTAIVNGFPLGWQVLGCCAPTTVPTRVCGDLGQLKMGGEGGDNRCYRRRSTDGLNWPPPDEVLPPCPNP
jgi:hypothetical protein